MMCLIITLYVLGFCRPAFAEVVQQLEQLKAVPHYARVQPAVSTGLSSSGAPLPAQRQQYQHQLERPVPLLGHAAAAAVSAGQDNLATAAPVPSSVAGPAAACAQPMLMHPAACQQQGLLTPVHPLNGHVAYCDGQEMGVMQWFQSLTQGYEQSTAPGSTSQLFQGGAMEVIPMVPLAQPAASSGSEGAMVTHAEQVVASQEQQQVDGWQKFQ
jgi:hypothetical protein